MSAGESSPSGEPLGETASRLAAALNIAADEDSTAVLSDEHMGQLFASLVRFYACKARERQDGVPPFAGNAVVTSTDVLIGCTAMLDFADLPPFELSAWRAWTSVGRVRPRDR